jgi:two-component system response regulator
MTPRSAQSPAGKYVLIAEDDLFLRKVDDATFRNQEGVAELQLVADGREAIDAIEKRRPDLMLLDLIMPNVDGFSVLEHVKEKGYAFPVIVYSNLQRDTDRDRCMALGAKDYIVKGELTLKELRERVKKYL